MGMMNYFEVPPEHHDAMDEMHRRIAPPCACPSIVWHIALWPDPEIRTAETVKEQNNRNHCWRKKVNTHLRLLEKMITGTDDVNTLTFLEFDREVGKPRKSLYLKAPGEGFVWRVKAESHFEFISLTVILSLNTGIDKNEKIYKWPKELSEISLERLSQAVDELEKSQVSSKTETLEKSSHLIHKEIWELIASRICSNNGGITKFPGQLMADFRGLALSVPNTLTEGGDNSNNRIVSNYEPLIRAIQKGRDHREFIVCGMLDGKAVYATTLGAHRKADENQKSYEDIESNPVLYTLFFDQDVKSHQVGRLVERINTLGVARIAALKNLDTLRNVGREVQAMGLRLDRIMKESRENKNNPLEILNFLNDLDNLKNIPGVRAGTIKDGITYRISRCSYYANLIETRLVDLRIQRIEGWQPYNEFLRRRLFPTLKFIQDLGGRIRTLRSRVDSSIMSLEATQTREILQSIQNIQERISRDEKIQTNMLEKQKEMSGQQQDSAKRQELLNERVFRLTIIMTVMGCVSILLQFPAVSLYILSLF